MKCPKCGFNSFEYFDSCKKCSNDLTSFKLTYSITPLVLPLEAKEQMAAEFRSAESATDVIKDTIETHDDIFSFDLPEESSPARAQVNDDPFNFNEPASGQSSSAKSDDVFADLLESTSQTDESPFATSQVKTPSAHSAAKSAEASSSSGEFDLDSFSWDDTPVASSSAPEGTEAPDDFDSLFGEAKEKSK